MKVSTNFEKIKNDWDKSDLNDFIHSSFLEIFYSKHPNIKHIFVINNDLRIYGHLLILRFDKISNYLNEKIAELTYNCLKNNVPSTVPGIAFLSGGQ